MMRDLFLCIAATALLAGCATTNGPSESERKADIMMQAGIDSLEHHDYSNALRSLLDAAKTSPKNPTIWTNLGIAYAGKMELAKAEESWKKALQLKSDYHDAHLNLGILYMRNKHIPEAERMLKEAANDPAYEKLHLVAFNLALIFLGQNKPVQAEQQLKIAVRENPGFCTAWLRLGRMQRDRGDYTEATHSLKEAVLGTCYKNPEAHYEIASLLLKANDVPQAKTKFLEIIQLFPQSDWAKKSEATLNMIH